MSFTSIDEIYRQLERSRILKSVTEKLKEKLQSYSHIDEIKEELNDVRVLLENLIELVPYAVNGKQLLYENTALLLRLKEVLSKEGLFTYVGPEVEGLRRLFVELWFSALLSLLKLDEKIISSFIAKISNYPSIHEVCEDIRSTFETPIKPLKELEKKTNEFWQKTAEIDVHLSRHIIHAITKRLLSHKDLKDLKNFIARCTEEVADKLANVLDIIDGLLECKKQFASEISDLPEESDTFNTTIIKFLCSKIANKKKELAKLFDANVIKEYLSVEDDINKIIDVLRRILEKEKQSYKDIREYKEYIKKQLLKLLENAGLQQPYYRRLDQWLKNVDEILARELKLSKVENQILEIVIEHAEVDTQLSIDIIVDKLKNEHQPTEVLKGIYDLCKRGVINCQLWL